MTDPHPHPNPDPNPNPNPSPNPNQVDNIMKDLQEELGVGRAEVIPKTIAMSGKKLSDTNVLIPYTMSAMFMVSKDAVRANPIEFYKKARQSVVP